MTKPKVSAVVQWALHGKAHDAEGYRILACSTGELGKSHFSDALSRFTMGGADAQPQVAVSYLKHGTEAATTYLALALTWYADAAQRYGDAVASRDMNGRETTFTSYFAAPYGQLAHAGVTYWDLYEAFGTITLPTVDGPPREITVTASAARNPAVEDLAMRTSALLLTGAPVCVLGADSTRLEERLRFIDTVMDLLPYGFRARMTAATWTKATNKNHKFKLFFSTAPRLGAQPDHVVTWDAPGQVAIPAGPPADYYESLSEKLNPISRLRTLTNEARFGPREAVQACELLDTGRFRLWRPQASWPGGDRHSAAPSPAAPMLAAAPAVKPGAGSPGKQPQAAPKKAGPAPAGHAPGGQPVAAAEPDPVEQALAACAVKIRDGNPSGLRTDIRWLENQAKTAAVEDARRRQYRALIGKYKLLAPHPELKKLEGELYAALLGLAFGKPLSYESYCQVEDCLAVDRGARLHAGLLNAIYEVGMANQMITAIVLAHLDAVDLHTWLKSGAADIVTMINLLGRPWDHPAHAQIFCDVTLIYLKQYPGHYDRAEVRRVLRQRGFLARTLYERHPHKEQYQYYALYGFLTSAYPTGLDAEAVIAILTGGNNPPPTPALYAAVLQLITARADLEVAWRAYAYGSAALLGVDSDTSKQLMARLPSIELRPAGESPASGQSRLLLPAVPAREIDPDPYPG